MLKHGLIIILLIMPALAVQITPSNDTEKILELQKLADSYHFIYEPELDSFDCTDMSSNNWEFFKEMGYAPKIAIREDAPNPGGHCYVIIPLADGWVGIETQRKHLGENRSLDHSIGRIITDLSAYKILESPEEVAAYDRSLKEGIRGPYLMDAIRPNPITLSLPPLFSQ